jgi:hypothetical protein
MLKTEFLGFVQVVPWAGVMGYLDMGKTAIEAQLALGKEAPRDPFAWENGVHYFQLNPGGKITFNLAMVKVWYVCRCQNDPDGHINAVINYKAAHPGASLPRQRRSKKSA